MVRIVGPWEVQAELFPFALLRIGSIADPEKAGNEISEEAFTEMTS